MGCCESSEKNVVSSQKESTIAQLTQKKQPKTLSSTQFQTVQNKVMQMKIRCQLKKQKCNGELGKKLDQFQLLIKKQLRQRSKQIEYQLLSNCTWIRNKEHIYEVLQGQFAILNQYKNLLQNSQKLSKVNDAVCTILFIKGIIDDEEVDSFCQFIVTLYPDLKDQTKISEIIKSDEIIIYHKSNREPSTKMIHHFALEVCTTRNVALQLINASGNNVSY